MQHRMGLGLALAVCAVAEAAEPTAAAPPVRSPPAAADSKPAVKKPLDLRIGDVRKYMMPNELRAALAAPDADKNTVVVEARKELLPVKYEEPIPVYPLGPLIWALKNPTQSWRILLPDLNRAPDGPPEVVPPPVFRWGP